MCIGHWDEPRIDGNVHVHSDIDARPRYWLRKSRRGARTLIPLTVDLK